MQDYHHTLACPSRERQPTNQTKTQHNYYPTRTLPNHWTNLRRAEAKWKKEFNLEAWEKQTSNTIN